MPIVENVTADVVRLGLDLAQRRAEVASRNIANAQVEGFRPSRVDFASVLERERADLDDPVALARTLVQLEADGVPVTVKPVASAFDAQVNLDEEMVEVTLAGANYQTLADALSRHMGLMRLAVQGRS